MADRRASSFVQHRSPSFSQARPTSIGSTSTTSRPLARRSASGGVRPTIVSSLTASDSSSELPLSFAHALSAESTSPTHSKVRIAETQQRSATTAASTLVMSKVDQATWPDASASTTTTASSGSPSSVWNGRPPSIMDGDAVTTPSTSNVSTPGRPGGRTSLDAKDAASNAPIFHPSPLLPQDGSAWSMSRPSSIAWANDLAARPTPPAELATESAASSPSAAKRATASDASAASINPSLPSSTLKDAATGALKHDSTAASTNSTKKTAAPVPKRAPIRSATLDPSHLAAKRRLSANDEDDDAAAAVPSDQPASAEDEELNDGIGTLTIATGETDSSSAVTQQQGLGSPPAFMGAGHHAFRPSGSFPPPPFSPGEAFMHPSPYFPGSGARSPDGYSQGYPNMIPGMAPIDMSGYESYRTTPDPYAPTMPGRAIFASPGSQGSTPQSPSFGPTPLGPHFNPSMRHGEALFYPGVVPGFGPPGMASPVRPGMPVGPGQYGFGHGPGIDARSSQLAQSPMMAPGMAMPVGALMMPPTSPSMNGSQIPPGGPDSRSSPSLSQSSPYAPGPHRRMGSSGAEPFAPGMAMSPRPPFGMTSQAGPFVPGQAAMHGMMGGAPMHGSMMAWNGRIHDHRRVPTGPGGVIPVVGGYGMGVGGGPMDQHFVRSVYGGAPFHPGGSGTGGPNNGGGAAAAAASNHSRSPLLEEFRSRHAKNRKFELADIYGSVVEFSSDQHGSRFIQEKLDTASDEEKKTLFDEVLPHARQLMTDVFGNYVIQKMLEHGSEEQRDVLGAEMEGHVLTLSLGTYGCRVVQKAFDHVSVAQREKLASELDGHIMQCVRDQNANHVVQKVVERVGGDKVAFVAQAFVGKVVELASHCYSCRVLQRCFEYGREAEVRVLLDELMGEVVEMMQHQYGNYVVQWVLQRGQRADREVVIGKIKGRVLVLSRHKFASNVIEQVVRTCGDQDRHELLDEILTPTLAGTPPAVLMMKDQFANYVLQRFLEMANPEQRRRLIEVLMPALAARKGAVGAKHLVAIERLIEGLQEQ